METVKLNRTGQRKVRQGICLLEETDVQSFSGNNRYVLLADEAGKVLGQGYLSQQNKGIGWLVSQEPFKADSAFFKSLFTKAKNKRSSYAQSDVTTAYRLFNQDGDGFGGLTIDFYEDYALFTWYNEFIYSQKEIIVEAFISIFPDIKGAYEKIRFKGLDLESAHLYKQEAPATFIVKENGVNYQVFLNDGLMTGIFLDQHEVRGSLVDGLAMGKSLLNMFSYTAAFSVAAAMGGALETTSVDLAKRSRELSEAHFIANGLPLENHRFVVMDVFEYFRYAKRKGLSYDVIVIDPPSFARNKKQTFSVAKDYHRLIAEALEILNPHGIIIASTNASNLTAEKFKKELKKGFGQTKFRYLATNRLPADFAHNKNDESSNYLKVFTIQVEK
ncbi:class I SAM-dependent rRNA methyltransferase [Streptococcus gallolyticus]|nr:class I SAM-dependent rRNA methyltransferase [Streptococcus gallolyticus]MBY5041071.1 class I SAM-dependent rRNA methyltransferase [Streptococcus gallolyticus]